MCFRRIDVVEIPDQFSLIVGDRNNLAATLFLNAMM